MVFTRKDLITKHLSDYEDSLVEMICIELTVARKSRLFLWFIVPPELDKTSDFFSKLQKCLEKAIRKY